MREYLTLGIIGQTGQLARALKCELSTSAHKAVFLNREHCDLSGDTDAIETALEAFLSVDVIIITAAYTQVDTAEYNEDTVMAVNAIAPGIVAAWAAPRDIPVIFISSDYVFNGATTLPYLPHTPTEPINVYGRSKVLGEQAVRAAQPRSVILRTSWVYDGTGENFLTKMLKLGHSRKTLDVVCDQTGRPTYAGHLALAVLSFALGLAKNDAAFTGTFHVSGSGTPISWAGFAREIFAAFAENFPYNVMVNDVPSSAFPTAAKRPVFSVLDLSKTEALLGLSLPDWRQGVVEAKRERHKNG